MLPAVQELTVSQQTVLEVFCSIHNYMISSLSSWMNTHLSLLDLLFSGNDLRVVMILLWHIGRGWKLDFFSLEKKSLRMELIVVFNNLMEAINKKPGSSQRCTAFHHAGLALSGAGGWVRWCPEIPSNQNCFMTISLEVPLIHTQIYRQGQLDPTDARVATCHLKWRKLEGWRHFSSDTCLIRLFWFQS